MRYGSPMYTGAIWQLFFEDDEYDEYYKKRKKKLKKPRRIKIKRRRK